MQRSVINLIAVAERSEHGYADVPPGSIDGQIESELATFGYAVAHSDHLWIGGYRVHTPESIRLGELQAARFVVNFHVRGVLACACPGCPRLRSGFSPRSTRRTTHKLTTIAISIMLSSGS